MMPLDARSTPSPGRDSPRADRRIGRDRLPVDLYPRIGDERWTDAITSRLTWAFVALGVLIRLVRLSFVHPLWGDECFVAANLIDRGYLGLLRPLDYEQVAPILFLWAELSSVKILGFSEWSLRLFPTVCAIASLFVFRHLAGRVMKGLSLVIAVGFVAVATNPIRHGGEAKPYAGDFLVATILLSMMVEWWRKPERPGWLWGLAAVTPIAMGFSLPSTFVLGGISLSIGWSVRQARIRAVTAAYLVFNAVIVVGVLVSLQAYSAEGMGELKGYMDHYWSHLFPPLSEPWRLPLWLLQAHTGQMVAYPVGGANGASLVTVVCLVAGAVDLSKRGRVAIVGACLSPLALALVASSIRVYPYGESERLTQFAGPSICLLAGYGLAWLVGRLGRPASFGRVSAGCLFVLMAIGLGSIVADFIRPMKTVEDLRAREFARSFWAEAGRDAELACARSDLGLDFEGGPDHHGRSADYLTYQKIFSSRHHRGLPLDWSRVKVDRPLRCVLYDGVPIDSPLFARWIELMSRDYRLARTETYRVNEGIAPKGVTFEDHLAVLEFIPKGCPVDPLAISREAASTDFGPKRGSMELSRPGPGLIR